MTLQQARRIVGKESALSDTELLRLVETLRPLARLIVEGLLAEQTGRREGGAK